MTPRRLLLRSLSYYKSIHLAVALGVAVGAAVLAGALLVGDSVRGSLRDLTLDRLGKIDHALAADRYFREALAGDVGAVPAVLIRGSVESADSGARASRISIHGVDGRFWELFGTAAPELGLRDIALNQSLANELGVAADGAVLVRFQTDTLVPSESVMGRKTDNVRTLRLTVKQVLPDRGPGRFGLSPSQQLPLNAFLPLATLQRALEQQGKANALFVASSPDAVGAADEALAKSLTLEDVELRLATVGQPPSLALETARIVLEQPTAEAAVAAAAQAGLAPEPVLTYLANAMTVGEKTIPYSTVTAIDGQAELRLTGGERAPALAGDELYLNDWAARDLGAKAGDSLRMTYYVVGEQGALETAEHEFSVKGVVRLAGLAADPHLAPRYEGMSDVERMGDWDPTFPVDLSLIRPIDEDYWERYRTAPKAFVAMERAKELWTSRFGQLTSIRLAGPVDGAAAFEAALLEKLDPAAVGLAFQPVKQQGLAASSGATDFSGLFIGFSMFLIAAAAMLVALLFRLGVEQRAKEIGLLLATGEPPKLVRRLLLTEGAVVAGAGCLLGLPGAVAYGALMVYGLRTWWSAAVGGSFLELHVSPVSLIAGLIGAFVLMLGSIWFSLRKLEKLSPRALLAGVVDDPTRRARANAARRPRIVAGAAALLALVLIGLSLATDAVPAAAGFFGVGALLLVAVLAFFRARLLTPARSGIDPAASAPLWRLGSRNSARFPTRSVLSAALVASAVFVIVTVAVNRHDVSAQEPAFDSGDGGFRLIAQSDLPLHQSQIDEAASGVAALFPLRVKLGDDASCLNLYQPSEPTLLGAPAALIERGGFAFQSSLAETDEEKANPWLLLRKEFPDGAIPVFGDANSVMWILHSGLGQTIDVEDEQGRPRKLLIAGLLSRSIFQSELILSEGDFLALRPSHSGFNMLLIDTDDAALGTALEERWGDLGFDATGTAERLAGYLVVENTYLSTFQTLGGLGLLLGTLGLAVVMVRNVVERRGELALLQAVGFGRPAVSHLVLAENAVLLVFGVAAGAGAALLAVAPHLISGLARPPWLSLALTLGAIVAVGLIAGAVAVRRSLAQPLLPSLRSE